MTDHRGSSKHPVHKAALLAILIGASLAASVTTAYASGPPENITLPTITAHEPAQGVTVTSSKGTWTQSPTSYGYKWEGCNASGEACVSLKNNLVVAGTYRPEAAGGTLRVQVTAKNSSGSTTVTSEPTAIVKPPGVFTVYGKPELRPYELVGGPDGNVWFASSEAGKSAIGKISTSGTITSVASLGTDEVFHIAPGLEGEEALWFTGYEPLTKGSFLKKITTGGSISEVSVGGEAISTAAQGSSYMWATEPGREEVAQIGPTGIVTQHHVGGEPWEIVEGEGGYMWVTLPWAGKIARLSSTGGLVEYPLAANSSALTRGPNGEVWFLTPNDIANISFTGKITYYPLPEGVHPTQLVTGADGRLWFNAVNYVGAMTTSGTVTMYFNPGSRPVVLAAGPDNNIWFVSEEGRIGKFTV
jgi:streptogramin lyase